MHKYLDTLLEVVREDLHADRTCSYRQIHSNGNSISSKRDHVEDLLGGRTDL